jgi:hypothetical protein
MPNIVYNRLTVIGTAEHVDKFVEKVRSDDLDLAGNPCVLDFRRHVPDTKGPQPRCTEITLEYSGVVQYTFTTAYSAPIGWVESVSAAEPYLNFEYEFVEEFEQLWGRQRWHRGVLVENHDIEPTDIEWAYEGDEDDDDEDEEYEEETIDRDAADTGVDVLATVTDRLLALQGLKRARTPGMERLAPVATAIGDAARISSLIDLAEEGYGVDEYHARFSAGQGRLIDSLCAHFAVAGAHSLLAAAAYRMKADKDIGYHTALHRVFDEAVEGVYDGKPSALSGPAARDWVSQMVDYLGDVVQLLHAEALWEEGDHLPDWVRRWGDTGAEAASSAFMVLASNCLCAIASLCPEGIDAKGIDLIGPEDQLRLVQDPRESEQRGRFRLGKRSID